MRPWRHRQQSPWTTPSQQAQPAPRCAPRPVAAVQVEPYLCLHPLPLEVAGVRGAAHAAGAVAPQSSDPPRRAPWVLAAAEVQDLAAGRETRPRPHRPSCWPSPPWARPATPAATARRAPGPQRMLLLRRPSLALNLHPPWLDRATAVRAAAAHFRPLVLFCSYASATSARLNIQSTNDNPKSKVYFLVVVVNSMLHRS